MSLPPELLSTAGGNTPCLELRAGDDLFIIDSGTGARALGEALMRAEFGRGQGHAHVFLSHFHYDHIQGWPFFKPAYVAGNRFEMHTRHENLFERLHAQQQPPFFPPDAWNDMAAEISYAEFGDETLSLCDGRVQVSAIELRHPSRAYAYRFECEGKVLVYASDATYHGLNDAQLQPYINFYRDADVLIFDAQFSVKESDEKDTWGHSSAVIGAQLAHRAGVKKLVLFHHAPEADDVRLQDLLEVGQNELRDLEAQSGQTQRCEIVLAREDMTIDL